jgi:hypothetical protein
METSLDNLVRSCTCWTSLTSSRSRFLQLASLTPQLSSMLTFSFLVSPTVEVSSLPPPTPENPSPVQHTFFSSASGYSFTVQPDPRGNTLGRGTEIVLNIGEEDMNFLSTTQLKDLV